MAKRQKVEQIDKFQELRELDQKIKEERRRAAAAEQKQAQIVEEEQHNSEIRNTPVESVPVEANNTVVMNGLGMDEENSETDIENEHQESQEKKKRGRKSKSASVSSSKRITYADEILGGQKNFGGKKTQTISLDMDLYERLVELQKEHKYINFSPVVNSLLRSIVFPDE